MKITIRPAKIGDIESIRLLIETYAKQQRLYPRSEAEIRRFIRSFFVAQAGRRIVGCVALEVYSPKISEVRSLAVEGQWAGKDIGSRLVEACLKRAKRRGIAEVMAITSSEHFFEKQGFSFALPHEKKALFYWTK